MDILAARKKAAELAKAAQQKTEQAAERAEAPAGLVPPAGHAEEAQQPADEAAQPAVAERAPAPVEQEETEPAPAEGACEAAAPAQELEMLAFLAGAEEYVVAVDRVKEVLKLRDITPVPHASSYVLGVCSLRGAVLPVVDLNKRLGLAGGARDEKSRIVVVRLENDDEAGILVDRVTGVVRFSSEAVKPAPETVEQGKGAEFLKGIVRKDDKLYIVLDLERTAG
jgi:purine-binding chemotaxis protein CheW